MTLSDTSEKNFKSAVVSFLLSHFLLSLFSFLRKYALPLVMGVVIAMIWKNVDEDTYWTARRPSTWRLPEPIL